MKKNNEDERLRLRAIRDKAMLEVEILCRGTGKQLENIYGCCDGDGIRNIYEFMGKKLIPAIAILEKAEADWLPHRRMLRPRRPPRTSKAEPATDRTRQTKKKP